MLNLECWRSHAQSYGLWPTLKHLGHRVGNRVVPHTTLVCIYITLQDADKQYLKVPESFAGRFLAADELHALTAAGEYGISKEFLSGALQKGDERYALLQGNRVAAFGMTHALRAYTERGCKGLVSFVESDNFASLRSCERMGYKKRDASVRPGSAESIGSAQARAAPRSDFGSFPARAPLSARTSALRI